MAKKNLLKPKKNPLFVVFYIIAAIVLIGCLGYLVYQSRERAKAYEETIARLAASETEYVSESQEEETKQEETQSESQKIGVMTESNRNAGTEEETAGEGTEIQTNQITNVKDLQILVLNGTEQSGVAAYWKNRLELQGYTHVAAASYKQLTEKTTIYTDHALGAEELKKLLPNAVLQPGALQGEYEIAEGSTQPETVDVYVVIGGSDAQNQ